MRQMIWVLVSLLSHWRRSPGQFVTLLIGLAMATALWSGVQALNLQARLSYDRAALNMGGEQMAFLAATDGSKFQQSTFVDLRKAGWVVSPVLKGRLEIAGVMFDIIGIEPVSMMQMSDRLGFGDAGGSVVDFMTSPGLTFISVETLKAYGFSEGERLFLETGVQLPPLTVRPDVPPGVLMVDIGVAQSILNAPGLISRLLIDPRAPLLKLPLFEVVGDQLKQYRPESKGDFERLTDSFHLNLTAFGFLSFFVGLFIVYSAIGLAFEQRRSMILTLRSCGVSMRMLISTLLIELLVLAVFAGLLGVILGYVIAATLLPDVAASIRGLYGAQISGELSLDLSWWIIGIAMSVFGALAAAGGGLWKVYRLPLMSSALPGAWYMAQQKWLRVQSAVAGLSLLLFVVTFALGEGLVAGFVMMGCLLLGCALLQPAILSLILGYGETSAKSPMVKWFWADSRQQLPGLSFALMALLLALSVNIGVGSMVESFRHTFIHWLDQRLAPEIYFNAQNEEQALEIKSWLGSRDDVTAVLPIRNIEMRFQDWPTRIYGFQDHATYRDNWPLLEATSDIWEAVSVGDAALISEQLARRFNFTLGSEIEIATPSGIWELTVAGIFSDYGNPKGLIMTNVDAFLTRWPDVAKTRHSVRVDPQSKTTVLKELEARFHLSNRRLVDQATMKARASTVFERTFAITASLNALTFGVAGIAMLCSLLTLSRSRLPQLAPLWAIGITRHRLAWIELAKSMLLALLTAVLALPLGLLLAWCLVAVINVQAFGWRLPFQLFPTQWALLLAMTLIVALLATIYPVLQLRRIPPQRLLKVFSDEH